MPNVKQDINVIWPDKIQMIKIELNLNVKSVITKENLMKVPMFAHFVNIMHIKNVEVLN